MSLIGNNIKYLRKIMRFGQEEVANALTLTQSAISSYEKGRSQPTPDGLIKLADLFGVTIDDLVRTDLSMEVQEQDGTPSNKLQLAELKNQIADLRAMVETQKQLIEVLQKNQKE